MPVSTKQLEARTQQQRDARTQQVMQTYLSLPPGVREQAVRNLLAQMDTPRPAPGTDPELEANAQLPMNALPTREGVKRSMPDASEDTRTHRWCTAKEMLMRLHKDEREAWLSDELSALGMIAGFIGWFLLFLPWFIVFRINSANAMTICLFAAVGGGSFLCKRLPRCIGEDGCIELLGCIDCALGRHDLKPDGVFLENGCQCVRCLHRPSARALLKLR